MVHRPRSSTSCETDWTMVDGEGVGEKALSLRPKTGDDVALSIHPLSSLDGVIVKVSPPKMPRRRDVTHIPCDIALVIDVSGSMSADAPVPGEPTDAKEEYGLSVLDLVKHAARTILETLDERDRLGIVTFASQANVVQHLIPINSPNKENTRENIDAIRPTDSINLWHGILKSISLFDDNKNTGRVPAIMVFTDGIPNHM